MGGFASGPGGVAAWLLRRPLVIHEQNAAAGLTNRLLARFAREVLQAFPGSFSAGITARTIGNPVRPELSLLASPEQRAIGRTGPLRVLVLGGSQGALALNQAVPAAAALLPPELPLEIWHQAGSATLQQAVSTYKELHIHARVEAFIDDMAAAYGWADMVICRSGALTVAELATVGLGAVLVPFPAAVDDHQTLNARVLVDAGAAVLMPQEELTPAALATELAVWAGDRQQVVARASRARKLARPDAGDALVAACLAAEAAA
jgi:UDP-N-acetylglucosamine--N-acetylmuramyl-(pentapeptide) pyrophosphoryl-undecaprenol N-acetylglucosamine transferase